MGGKTELHLVIGVVRGGAQVESVLQCATGSGRIEGRSVVGTLRTGVQLGETQASQGSGTVVILENVSFNLEISWRNSPGPR